MSSQYAWSSLFPADTSLPEGYDGPPFTGLRPGAGEPELRQLEERLGMPLPPSYRDFLRFADGFGWGPEDEEDLLSTATIGWLRDLEPEWLDQLGARGGRPGAERPRRRLLRLRPGAGGLVSSGASTSRTSSSSVTATTG